jgi:tetratricopeptide (TPR) repeat protein
MPTTSPPNPFPGLRPFEPDEDHLFFGREKEIDDLLRRLRFNRFLAVVGTSGCGKSSLIRSGLLPSLESGMMAQAGSSWRMAIMRPGHDPIGNLARALDAREVLGRPEGELAPAHRVMLEATLRRGTRGLIDAVRLAHLPASDHVLVVVDQFEELFRFRRRDEDRDVQNDAVAFVKLLLEAARQQTLPIFVVITMRSDYLGECMNYPELPEALNESQYLVPRMTRDELRSAITGPIAVGGGQITPRLVLRLLTDVTDDRDDLPLLQHALMRTWDHWVAQAQPDAPLDIPHYEAVGTLRRALSIHAEEAYAEAEAAGAQPTTELMFRALTDTVSDPRGIRRPTCVADLAAICAAPEGEVTQVVEIFRRPGRSFLMPPVPAPLKSDVIVDLSHEILMRCWTRLVEWTQDERHSAAIYQRLAREAEWYERGEASLWRDPELELGLRWRDAHRPTAAWAQRYGESFDRAIAYLDRSEQERSRERAERRAYRVRRLVIAWGTAAALLVMTAVLLVLVVIANRQRARAEQNLGLAADAVGELLVSVEQGPDAVDRDVPALQRLRHELLTKARPFYDRFLQQGADDEIVSEMAIAHLNLGHVNRMLNDSAEALTEYDRAARAYEDLARRNPEEPRYRSLLATAHNWRGETLRVTPGQAKAAASAYARALELQTELVGQDPGNPAYVRELARTYYNRGILRGEVASPGDAAFAQAEADFREAIRRLEALPSLDADLEATQDLSRAVNNLAALIGFDTSRLGESRPLYERAIGLHDSLVRRRPEFREYKYELARYLNNYAAVMLALRMPREAAESNRRAMESLDDLVLPAPALGIEYADTHTLRGLIRMEQRQFAAAVAEYSEALLAFDDLARSMDAAQLRLLHERFGDLLDNLARLSREQPAEPGARALLLNAVSAFVQLGERALAAGLRDQANGVVQRLAGLEIADRDRPDVSALRDALLAKLRRVP